MKFVVTTVLLFSFSFSSLAEKPQEITAPLGSVKVCLNAAVLTHVKQVSIKTGNNKLVFLGLAANVNPNHISLRNLGSAELLGLTLFQISDTTDILSLPDDLLDVFHRSKDSVLLLEKNIVRVLAEISALELEKQMLAGNTDVINSGKLISAAEMKVTTDYYRDRFRDVTIELRNKKKESKALRKQKVRMLKSAFNVTNESENSLTFSIIIAEINNAGAVYNTDLELTYVAHGAGWIPVYDIYANGNKNLKINYRAKILNNTGIDWNNQKITVSTADPSEYYEAPSLEPFYVNRYSRYSKSDYEFRHDLNPDYNYSSPAPKFNPNEEEIYTPDKEVNFALAKAYDFSTGTIPSLVDVTTYELTPQFFYRCAPKMEEQAYSIAQIKDWEKLNLIDGEASIYNNMVFLGKSYIRPSDIEEYLELPLGVMENIYIHHKLVSDVSSKRVLAGEVVATQQYEIKIKNTGAEKIRIEVLDQIPVSSDKSVKTNIIEITEGHEQDAETGEIVWPLEINGNSEKTLVLKYSVSYPKRSGYSMNQSYQKRQVRAKF